MASTTILIIDDEQDVIDLLTLHLRKAGYALSTATDGAIGASGGVFDGVSR